MWNEEGGSVRKVAKKEVKCMAGGGRVPHRSVRRREVHGSDYKEASRGVGECEGYEKWEGDGVGGIHYSHFVE